MIMNSGSKISEGASQTLLFVIYFRESCPELLGLRSKKCRAPGLQEENFMALGLHHLL